MAAQLEFVRNNPELTKRFLTGLIKAENPHRATWRGANAERCLIEARQATSARTMM